MSLSIAERKVLRGTKRQCLSCEVRFYDLARAAIVCPACKASFTVVADPVVQARAKVAYAGKAGWRTQPSKRAEPEAPHADLEAGGPAEDVAPEVEADDSLPLAEDTIVLDQDLDDEEPPKLIDEDSAEPNRE